MNPYERAAAARAGDLRALDELVAEYLPLVYNIVGRALDNPADTDDVVQNVFVEALRDLRKLRDPAAFRSWLVAITMREVRRHWRLRHTAPAGPVEAEATADPGADFVDLTITTLQLSGQRREVSEATRWLEPDDRELLALWWLEVAGRLTRSELAEALGLSAASAAVRVQRMRVRLDTARFVVRALRAAPSCSELSAETARWDGRPSGLWRKRLARHVRECDWCARTQGDVIPAERLLAGLPLVIPPHALASAVRSAAATHSAATTPSVVARAAKALLAGKAAALSGAAVVVLAVAGGVVVTHRPDRPPPAAAAARVVPAPVLAAPSPSLSPVPAKTAPTSRPPSKSAPKRAVVADSKLPIRGAFYYPWYAENFQGADGGSHWHPSAGKYSVDNPVTVDRQIRDMKYGGLNAGISSWWGRGKREDKRFPLLLKEADKLGFTWSLYYEPEGYGNPSSAQILSDLRYLGKYTDDPAFLHLKGKPVIFVWADGTDACGMAGRWAAASKTFYVVLKVFGEYQKCAQQPDGWHQYGVGQDIQRGYSALAGPGFWHVGDAASRLARDPARFRKDVTAVARSGEPFQLITSYNEWGEGTAVESATEWTSPSGHGIYMDILHDAFGGS